MPPWLTIVGNIDPINPKHLYVVANTSACNDIGYYEVELEPITTQTC
jgi:hypothetical protein